MNPVIYWRSALGLFWAFMFFVLLALVVGLTYLEMALFYSYAIFLSAILLLFLAAFLLFKKRAKVGLYLFLILSSLFVFNQLLTLYFLFVAPAGILPVQVFAKSDGTAELFPLLVSFSLLLWGLLLFFASWKSKPLFEAKAKKENIAWLSELKSEKSTDTKNVVPVEKQIVAENANPPWSEK